MRTNRPVESGKWRQAWIAFRGWPRWAQITAWVVLAIVVLGSIGSDSEPKEVELTQSPDPQEDVAEKLPRATTTMRPATTLAPATTVPTFPPTTTTAAPTTTTAAPTTTPRVTAAPTTAAPPAAGSGEDCHPSYSGVCLPFTSDVDCAGGSGNGPEYTSAKNIRVVGPDEYDLDRDGNGLGCEP